MRFSLPVAILSLLSALPACGGDDAAGSTFPAGGAADGGTSATGVEATTTQQSSLVRNTSPGAPDADMTALVNGNDAFAYAMYAQLAGADATSDLFFSPYSISLALGMAYAGAAGGTATEMATALDFTLPPAQLFAAFDQLDLQLRTATAADGTATLDVANAFWAQTGLPLVPAFLDTLATSYGAGVQELDIDGHPALATNTINQWVAAQTSEKITNLLPPGFLDSETTTVLVNAVYFDAHWANFGFSPNAVGTTWQGTSATPLFMSSLGTFAYAHVNGVQAVEIPYVGGRFSMVILLPDTVTTPAFAAPTYGAAVAALTSTPNVYLAMPEFAIHGASISLKTELSALGMPDAFSDAADFSALSSVPTHVSDVVHQASVNVDLSGTEATAATAAGTEPGAIEEPPPDAVMMKVDHPFVFALRDQPTGTLLFVGRVETPSGAVFGN
jgi:serpin B